MASTAQERYIDSIFTEINVRSFVFSDTLELDFYSAKNNELTDRPIMILVHGGGFAIGKKDNLLEKKFCTAMAAKGYAVASISYRLTRKGKSFDCDCPTEEKLATFKTASEDVLKAVGHLAKNTGSLGFDRNKIILVGSSAGAEAVLNTVFMRYHRDFRQLPYGNLQFAGVISFSGAVLNADYITEQTAIPTLLFHGVKDKLVPYGTAAHHYCDEDTPGYLPLDGSNTIAQRLSKLGAPYTLYVDMEGNHDWANKAYAHTHDISNFIKTVILDGVWQQSKIRLTP
ncbi:alpha/beta hydrolase [Allomuricauda sp. SCSIO 65647]|uniref:alpha/beta hydrolase n=1 Tax=Allomuricauda sp. SCSIO 65647 TaxID=2908843 RepID=UPI001F2D0767|nr:alpha/beta hydrolase [Muricauda sp. SCSIO 65647]UJH66359.1 alpha/beta hydrolase [Muricauda sp. SCSIO 65647]